LVTSFCTNRTKVRGAFMPPSNAFSSTARFWSALTCGASRKRCSVTSCATASPSALTSAPQPAVSFALRASASSASE
jgi:hypothetical protein